MKVKFEKQVTVEFVKDSDEFLVEHDKTFYPNEVVEVNNITEVVRGFLDLTFDDGVAIGVPKQGLTIL
jgi:hypothetical protein